MEKEKTISCAVAEFDKLFDDVDAYCASHSIKPFRERAEAKLTTTLTQIHDQAFETGKSEGRKEIIKDVEDTIAEFGDQGMECVAGILEESFHGQREVLY